MFEAYSGQQFVTRPGLSGVLKGYLPSDGKLNNDEVTYGSI